MKRASRGDDVPLLRRLHVQAAGVVLLVLATLAVAIFDIDDRQRREAGLEANQRLNLDLAGYIAAHQAAPLVDAAGRVDTQAMRTMATQAMTINPAIEVYLLDPRGVVVAHALADVGRDDPVGRQVDLGPVRQIAATPAARLRLPVLGADPRVPGRRTIVSAAALPRDASGRLPGWLYVVLESAAAAAAAESSARSRAWAESGWTLATATALAALVMVLALRWLTQPLRALTARVRRFHRDIEDGPATRGSGEIVLLSDAVDAMQRRIELQLARLQEADRLRRELVGNISHDLRTPLSNVQGYVETVLLRADRLDAEERAQHLRTALRHADLLGRRIAELFELSTLDAGRVVPKLEVFCLGELLQDVTRGYQLDAQRRGVALVFDAGSHLAVEVRADIALIERVLQNLIDNALRHTPSGGRVTLALEARGTDVEVRVTDTGSGIAAEHLAHVFERYWRAADEVEKARAPGNSGLGLAIVKRILELHGSGVVVRSMPREGASFAFLLPRAA